MISRNILQTFITHHNAVLSKKFREINLQQSIGKYIRGNAHQTLNQAEICKIQIFRQNHRSSIKVQSIFLFLFLLSATNITIFSCEFNQPNDFIPGL